MTVVKAKIIIKTIKLLVLDRNTGNHKTARALFVLNKNSLYHITECQKI